MIFLSLIGAAVVCPALAQEPPPPTEAAGLPAPSEEEGFPALPEDLPTYAEGWIWRPVRPAEATDVRFVSLTGGEGWVLAADERGRIWRSRDGETWYAVKLGGEEGMDEEELLLEAEAMQRDFSDEVSEGEGEEETSTVEGADTLGVEDLLDGAARPVEEAALPLVWSDPTSLADVLAALPDGLWRSTDAGRSFERVESEVRYLSFAPGPGALVVAGTDSGLLYSLDGGLSWIDQEDPLDGRAVTWLATGASGFWYAVADGALFASSDAETWEELPLSPIVRRPDAVLEEPGLTGSLWIASEGWLYRDDRGETEQMGAHPLGGLRRLILVGPPGHLFWAGEDGVWESRDGGLSWRTVTAGLPHPRVYDVAALPAGIFAVGELGLYRLIRASEEVKPAGEAARTDESLPFGLLVDRALHRSGVDPIDYGISASRAAARNLLPELTLRGEIERAEQLLAYYTEGDPDGVQTGINTGARQNELWLQVELRWGGSSYSDGETSFDVEDVTDDLFVLGDQVYVDEDGASGYAASASANVTTEAATYQTRLAAEVAGLCAAREQLLRDRASLVGEDLRTRVQHELAIHEINARIDAFTDGALTALLAADDAATP